MKVLNQSSGKNWNLYQGDCIEIMQGIPENSIHYTVTSPPFASLYVYSNSLRDMGNSTYKQFHSQFRYYVDQLHRIMIPGRIVSQHCMNIPASLERDGYIGLKDFRGALIRSFLNDEAGEFYQAIERLKTRQISAIENEDQGRFDLLENTIQIMLSELSEYPSVNGFIFHSEVCIWKNPVVAMQRTKSIRLLHKQLRKDSTVSGQGIADYFISFRKPGKNPDPVSGLLSDYQGAPGTEPVAKERSFEYTSDDFDTPQDYKESKDDWQKEQEESVDVKESINIWQRYASPVWMDINPSETLAFRNARSNADQRHICPLQLQVISRGIQLWSNPGDIVLDTFNGIGSSGVVSLEQGRKYVGLELKSSYYDCSVTNLTVAESTPVQWDLFKFETP